MRMMKLKIVARTRIRATFKIPRDGRDHIVTQKVES